MLPDHQLSSQLVFGYYLFPDNLEPSPLIDWEMGGAALNDPTQGLYVKPWYARLEIDGVTEVSSIWIGSDTDPEVLFLQQDGITTVSLSFDQNMNPVVAYMQNSDAKFYWFDTLIPGYTTTTLPVGTGVPRCCLDDKREMERETSDILLFYTRSGTLYFREQRDRYTVEYSLETGVIGDVLVCGMTDRLRVQIGVGQQDYPPGTVNYRITVPGDNRVTVNGDRRRLVRLSYG